jgi:hypothetical protein
MGASGLAIQTVFTDKIIDQGGPHYALSSSASPKNHGTLIDGVDSQTRRQSAQVMLSSFEKERDLASQSTEVNFNGSSNQLRITTTQWSDAVTNMLTIKGV